MKNIILALISSYFIISFCIWNLNINEWEIGSRIILILFWAALSLYLELEKK